MKNKLASLVLPIITLFILSACSTPSTEDLMRDIDEATQKNGTLNNATYEFSVAMSPDINQTAEGVFIALENGGYNWTHREYLGDGQNFSQTAEIDGWQYEMLWVDDPEFEPEWKRPEGKILTALELLHPLFENTIGEEYIGKVEVTEENGKQYRVMLNDTYLEDNFSETHPDIDLSNPMFDLQINAEGYLTKYASSYTFTTPEEETVSTTIQYELTDYNLEDPTSLLPEIK